MSEAEVIESIRVGQGQEKGSEETKALYQDIRELKEMITSLMERMDENKVDDLREMINQMMGHTAEESSSELAGMMTSLVESVGRLRAATLAMAARVDATAEPVNTFESEFQDLI